MDITANVEQYFVPWFFDHGIKILGIILAFFVVKKATDFFIERLIRKAVVARRFVSPEAEKKREDTLIRIFSTTFDVFLLVIVAIMILSELGVNTAAMVAGLGVAGVAVGFGAQYLIKDLISGFFIIMENQYRVGDVVCFGDTCGVVEDISLRMTTLRDLDGTVHHVPNGEVAITSNLTKYRANINIDVQVAYDADLEKIIKVVNRVGENLSKDKQWKDLITKPPQFLRVDDFADSGVVIKILGETKPLKQWDVAGEFRKRLKKEFDKEHIEIPFPQRVLHMKK